MDKIHEELFPTHDEAITDWTHLIMKDTNAPNEKLIIMSDQELEFYLRRFKVNHQIPKFHIWFDEGHWPAEVLFVNGDPYLVVNRVIILD